MNRHRDFVAKTLEGERLTSESLKGKVVLLDFWATWCPPCKKDESAVESVIAAFQKEGLVVLAVNMGEPRRKVKKYLEASPRVFQSRAGRRHHFSGYL